MGLHAGRLRHVIEIQESIQVQNLQTGGMIDRWQTVTGCSAVPAEIVYISGREFISSNAKQSEIVARITIRNRTGLTTKMRIIGMGKTFNIEGLLPDHETGNTWLTIPVSEVLASGNALTDVAWTNTYGTTVIESDTIAVLLTGDWVATQDEFNPDLGRQDFTVILGDIDVAYLSTITLPFDFENINTIVGCNINSAYSTQICTLGNLATNDFVTFEIFYNPLSQYSISYDKTAGTYGALWFYENSTLLQYYELTEIVLTQPNAFTVQVGTLSQPIETEFQITLVNNRAYNFEGSTHWTFF